MPNEDVVPAKRQKVTASRHRNFTFTHYFTDLELPEGDAVHEPAAKVYFATLPVRFPALKYAIAQLERCPETQRYHVQGFFVLKNPLSFESARKKLSPDHVEIAVRSPLENIVYCSKEETKVAGPFEYGKYSVVAVFE